ncbi:MAG TPA: D-serine ammonia-lyase [Bacillota bacterium]|nr:D-serine ammonia-lyase [Bacillota bacterium]
MKIVSSPLMERLGAAKEIFWLNPKLNESESSLVNQAGVEDARKRLERFAAYFVKAFPETAATGGLIESHLIPLPNLTNSLQLASPVPLTGRFFLKGDHDLPISGSIKARGGIYEILVLAEKIALESGMLKPDQDYSILTEPQFHQLFSHYAVAVGSTGNLGLSIGIMSAKLGFQVTVHMSADARQWKKDLLRSKGAIVVEYDGDFMLAVQQGRKQAALDPACHFVDDENSTTLFYGYSVAGKRTAEQLLAAGVLVDAEHPLFVYLPCGVGGSPGGITYGLKQQYGSHVHCIFAEPVQSPCMLLGVATGLHDEICVQDIGLSGKTALDGLAVGRPSKLIGRIVGHRLDAIYTLEDAKAYAMLTRLYDTEGIALEPSASVGLFGYQLTQSDAAYRKRFTEQQWSNATHIAWATGGSMVPEAEMAAYIEKGRLL